MHTFAEELDTDDGEDGEHDEEGGGDDDPHGPLGPHPPQDGPEGQPRLDVLKWHSVMWHSVAQCGTVSVC